MIVQIIFIEDIYTSRYRARQSFEHIFRCSGGVCVLYVNINTTTKKSMLSGTSVFKHDAMRRLITFKVYLLWICYTSMISIKPAFNCISGADPYQLGYQQYWYKHW